MHSWLTNIFTNSEGANSLCLQHSLLSEANNEGTKKKRERETIEISV
jgi:hypothetical protein